MVLLANQHDENAENKFIIREWIKVFVTGVVQLAFWNFVYFVYLLCEKEKCFVESKYREEYTWWMCWKICCTYIIHNRDKNTIWKLLLNDDFDLKPFWILEYVDTTDEGNYKMCVSAPGHRSCNMIVKRLIVTTTNCVDFQSLRCK